MYKSLDKIWDGGFLQVEQSQLSWNRTDAFLQENIWVSETKQGEKRQEKAVEVW